MRFTSTWTLPQGADGSPFVGPIGFRPIIGSRVPDATNPADAPVVCGAAFSGLSFAAPFASARVGSGGVFVSEVDESDGSIALYRPQVALLGNVSLDHKSLEELRSLFGDFLGRAGTAVVNLDDAETAALAPRAQHLVTFAIDHPATLMAQLFVVWRHQPDDFTRR